MKVLSAWRFPVLWLALVLPAGLWGQAAPTISKAFGATHIPLGGNTSLSFTLTNFNESLTVFGASFSDTLPAGLVISTPNGLTGSCAGGTITATAASTSVSLSGANMAPTSSCTFSMNVTGIAVGVQNNTTSTVACDCSSTEATASASVTVDPPNPPTIGKSFGAASIAVGATTSLNFTIANPNAGASLSGVGFTDTLPAGLVVATPNGLAGSCGGGAIAATAASGSVSLTGATLAASASCTFSVNVTGSTVGTKNNTTGAVASNEAGAGGTASASLAVQGPTVPVLSPLALAALTLLLAGLGWVLASRQAQRSRPNV